MKDDRTGGTGGFRTRLYRTRPFRTHPNRPYRRSIRLKGYDYAQAGAYFITICTQNRECLFGDIVDGEMRLNETGKIVEQCWCAIPDHFAHVELDAFVVMPNHIHGIVVVGARHVGARHAVPLHAVPLHALRNIAATQPASCQSERFGKPISGTIPTIVRSFKSAVTKRVNEHRQTPGLPVWQRNYYEHVVRNDASFNRIREYIANNPLRWALDRENPDRVRATHAALRQEDESWCV